MIMCAIQILFKSVKVILHVVKVFCHSTPSFLQKLCAIMQTKSGRSVGLASHHVLSFPTLHIEKDLFSIHFKL